MVGHFIAYSKNWVLVESIHANARMQEQVHNLADFIYAIQRASTSPFISVFVKRLFEIRYETDEK